MTSIFSDGALHPGRDANDAWWIVVRRAEEWGDDPRPPADYETRYDATRGVLELAPLPLAAAAAGPIEATAPDGTRYLVDPIRHQLLRHRACDAAPVPLPGVGGRGWSTGRFDTPVAIAVDDHGWIYVVERGNHRVQVIDPHDPIGARVVIVLGGADAWGRPVAGDGRGLLRDPVAVAVGGGRLHVATATGTIQAYDRGFRPGLRFAAVRPGDGVVVAEAGWSRLAHYDCRGGFVGELGLDEAPPGLAGALERARFALEGTRVVGPIDGGIDGLAWHQIAVDAILPAGTSVEVQTWAADAVAAAPPVMSVPPTLPLVTPWAPALPVAMPIEGLEDAAPQDGAARLSLRESLTGPEPRRGELLRPVLPDPSAWERWSAAPFRRGASFALTGTGPNGAATLTAPYDLARRLRVDDELELRTAAATALPTIATISDRTVSVIATGDRVVYPGGPFGAELWLHERAGRAIDPVRVHTLAAGEVITFGSIPVDGGGADLVWPHACAALVRRDDLVELRHAGQSVTVRIEAIDLAPATIGLVAAVAGDFRTSTLRLVEAAGNRVVTEHADGWGPGFPPGGAIDVSYLAGTTVTHALHTVVWSDPEVATVWLTAAPPATWFSLGPDAAPVATDRGRYLWIKLRLRGARRHPADTSAIATPLVRALRAIGPRLSYLSYLPAVYGRRDDDTPTGALFLERFLAMFEGRLTRVESRYEAIAHLLNPLAADDDWLAFVASWFDLVLDPSWPRARRARLLAQIFSLYKLRGTREGIVRTVEAYTGQRPALLEGFQVRPRAGIVLGCAGVLGCAPLGGLDVDAAAAETLLAAYAHRFTLIAYVDDDCELDLATLALRTLVDAIKPAHTDVDLRLAVPHGRIGLESTVGLDFILGDDRARRAPLGTSGAHGHLAPVLGVDAALPSSSAGASSHPPLALGALGGAPVGSFTIR